MLGCREKPASWSIGRLRLRRCRRGRKTFENARVRDLKTEITRS
jgi:hypothetical protein